jgi:hypothetical protein
MCSLCTQPLLTNEQNHLFILFASKTDKTDYDQLHFLQSFILSAVAHENFLVVFNEGLRQSETKGIPISLIVSGQSVGYLQG